MGVIVPVIPFPAGFMDRYIGHHPVSLHQLMGEIPGQFFPCARVQLGR